MPALNWVQWPAMVVTVAAGWLVASSEEKRRSIEFWLFLLSNALLILWGFVTGAIALIVLQICLAAMNRRGAKKTKLVSGVRDEQTDPGCQANSS